jgi:hypothetical protein
MLIDSHSGDERDDPARGARAVLILTIARSSTDSIGF